MRRGFSERFHANEPRRRKSSMNSVLTLAIFAECLLIAATLRRASAFAVTSSSRCAGRKIGVCPSSTASFNRPLFSPLKLSNVRQKAAVTTARRASGNNADSDSDSDNNSPSENTPKKKGVSSSGNKSTQPQRQNKQQPPLKGRVASKLNVDAPSKKSSQQPKGSSNKSSILEIFNPFKAGKKLRQTLDTALSTLGTGLSSDRRSIYYLDDRFLEPGSAGTANRQAKPSGAALFAERNPLFDRLEGLDADTYIPEVLVVGATGEVGRLVVRRLLREGRFRVRVLVRDLYSQTLNMLGTGVTYCQGDLKNIESLEYAVTDVDKIVFCAGAPKPDEEDFRRKFQDYTRENLERKDDTAKKVERGVESRDKKGNENSIEERTEEASPEKIEADRMLDIDWKRMESIMEVRSKLAEQIDCVGMQNLVRAYQNVRHTDYGTSQAAKRSLFKFQDQPEDFSLFSIDAEAVDMLDTTAAEVADMWADMEKEEMAAADAPAYDDGQEAMDEDSGRKGKRRSGGTTTKAQCSWIKNKFDHGVFVGRVPASTAESGGLGGGEAAIVSSRLRSREDPEKGIDLSSGFAGFVCRLVSGGGTYEAFIRTKDYDAQGIEYVCEFGTGTKVPQRGNRSTNKFITVRLPFSNFKPMLRGGVVVGSAGSSGGQVVDSATLNFNGKDVRQIGFRFRSDRNQNPIRFADGLHKPKRMKKWTNFYLGLCYIKVYRSQPEPEFIYLSDARIPPVVQNKMVRHNVRQILPAEEDVRLFDQKTVEKVTRNPKDRSGEETYFKFRGEQILRNSGLSYAIVRVSDYNELPSGEASTVRLQQSNENLLPVSRAEVADVCVSALLDPNASNVSFYMTKAKRGKSTKIDETMATKFVSLQSDS